LAVYTWLVREGLHYNLAAAISFLVAVTNNYTWNRLWSLRGQRGNVGYQGLRFLVVSLLALAANEVLLTLFVAAGAGKVVAQAIAIVLVTPINFVGNKLWSFRRRGGADGAASRRRPARGCRARSGGACGDHDDGAGLRLQGTP